MLLLYVLLVFQTIFAVRTLEKDYYDLEDAEWNFERFIKICNKKYENEIEKATKLDYFKNNVARINELNKNDPHCVYGINKFADLSPEEFIMQHTGLRAQPYITPPCTPVVITNSSINLPDTFDWRDHILIKVKDQGACGSGWAFIITGNVESQYAIKHKKNVSLSVQQLVDCDFTDGGCMGGLYPSAFKYLIESGGQASEKDYPYETFQRTCRFSPEQAKVKVSDCLSIYPMNEDLIKEALVKYGPLTAAVDGESIFSYQRGVMTTCEFESLNHGVLLVGYGTDEQAGDYWVIMNSWGVTWGEAGFARIKRGVNACGIYNDNLATSVVE